MANIENVLLKSENNIKALFNGIPIPTFVWQHIDDEIILIDFNRAAEEYTHGNVKNYLNRKASEFYHDRQDILKDLYTCLNSKENFFRELEYTFRSGENKFIAANYGYISPDIVLVHIEDISEQKRMEHELKKSIHSQNERIKELLCLYGISDLAIKPNITIDEFIRSTNNLIPHSMQFPHLTCTEIKYGNKLFRTSNFRETPWKLSTSIIVIEKKLEINVYYLEDKPFLDEESHLLNDIIHRIETIMGKKKAEEDLKKLNLELENRIIKRTEELKESDERLKIFMESAHNTFMLYDSDLNLININEVGIKHFPAGTTEEDIIGKNIVELSPDIKKKGRYDEYMEVLRTGNPFFVEEFIPHPKFGNLYISLNAFKVFDGLGIVARDITEAKKAEEKLKESEEKYRTLFESSKDGILFSNMDGKIINCNQAYLDMLGYTLAEIQEFSYQELTPEKWQEIEADIFNNKFLPRGYSGEFEKEYIRKDGIIIPISINVWLIKDDQGNNKGMWGIVRNITERNIAELKLRESEERWRSITKYTPDNIMQLDLNLNILFINHTVPDLSITEVIGKPIYQFVPEKYVDNMKEVFARVLNTGKSDKYETVYRDKEGNNLFFEAHVGPIWDSGQIIGFIARSTDITERRKVEDKDIWKSNTMKAINEVFKKALTCETEEELGKTCLNVAQELSGAKFGFFGEVNSEGKFDTLAISNPGWDECTMPGSTATRLIKGMEIRGMQFLPLKDGIPRIFNDPSNHSDSVGTPKGHPAITSLLAIPILYKGEIIGQIGLGNKEGGFTHDDLEAIETLSVAMIEALLRKRAEENSLKSEEKYRISYKRAEFYKDLFAHDINNILNSIKGASDLYLLYENDSTKRRETHSLINIIKDQVIKGALLVSNVRKLSQLEDEKDVELEEMNVREFMNKAKKYTQGSFQERDIKIDEYYFIEKPIILANELLLDVFENIFNNAVKYNSSPIVRIQIKISREIENGKNYVKIEFINNGIGVIDEKKEIIFKKGYAKEKGTKGMGFGLTLVKTLINSYEGKIWVEDNVKGDYTQGSNFVLIIPEVI